MVMCCNKSSCPVTGLTEPGFLLPQHWLRWRSSEHTQPSRPMNSLSKLLMSFWFIKK